MSSEAEINRSMYYAAIERYGDVCMTVIQKIADGGTTSDVLEIVGDSMNGCDHVDDEVEELWDRAKAVAVAGLVGHPEPTPDPTIYDEIRAERERAHAKHGDTSMEMAPVTEMYRAVILGEEIGEVAEVAWAIALTAKFSYVQKALNDGRHDGATDLVKLRRELVQVATMAAAWADRIEVSS